MPIALPRPGATWRLQSGRACRRPARSRPPSPSPRLSCSAEDVADVVFDPRSASISGSSVVPGLPNRSDALLLEQVEEGGSAGDLVLHVSSRSGRWRKDGKHDGRRFGAHARKHDHGCVAGRPRVPDAAQRATSRHRPSCTDIAVGWAPAQQRITQRGAALHPGHESGLHLFPSGSARFFFFERCQTTPGKPFSGTSGSPV